MELPCCVECLCTSTQEEPHWLHQQRRALVPLQHHLVYPVMFTFHASILECENHSLLASTELRTMEASNLPGEGIEEKNVPRPKNGNTKKLKKSQIGTTKEI